MAEARISQDQFSCSVCLDLLKDPVTIPCGHSYCMSCITECWDKDDQTGDHSCPQCKQIFPSRPALCKNVMFAEMLEKLKHGAKLQTAQNAQCYAGPKDVDCDICMGRKYKAVKSCLECLKSYCQNHLEQHENFFRDRRHNLTNPTRHLPTRHLLEKLKHGAKLQTAQAAQCYAGPKDVDCDICMGRKYKAVKSCLECLKSYCQNHLEQHENFFRDRRHNLTNPTRRHHELLCPQHKKQQEIYCRTDKQCICYLCILDTHKNHEAVAAIAERTEKEKLLKERQKKSRQKIQEKEKKCQELREAVKNHKHLTQKAVEDSERIFTEIIHFIERRRSDVIQLVRYREKTAVSKTEVLLKHLEKEIYDLKRRDTELEQLLQIDDDICFLQSYLSLSEVPQFAVSHSLAFSPSLSFDDVRKSVSQLKEKLEDFCRNDIHKIPPKGTAVTVPPSSEPKTREDFRQYFHQFTLDANTVQQQLCLSDENRTATHTNRLQQYPDHTDRFDTCRQVLCTEGVRGCCYWEVEWTGPCVFISVSYKTISRKGVSNACGFGYNNLSWSLICSPSRHRLVHNNSWTDVSSSSSCSRIGVYVDHSAGTLSFYSVFDTMSLIHRVQTTFTQPLYPGFVVTNNSSVKLCQPD